MLSVIKQSVIMLSDIMLSANVLNVAAPIFPPNFEKTFRSIQKWKKTQKIKITVATFAISRLNISVKAVKIQNKIVRNNLFLSSIPRMELRNLKNVNSCWNAKI
jgi:hypothetical protein